LREKKLLTACLMAFGVLAAPVIWSNWTGVHCSVHRVSLRRGFEPVIYGDVGVPLTPRFLFPNANSRVYGGCIVSSFSPPYAVVEYCPQCREAEAQWFTAHPANSLPSNWTQLFAQNERWWKTHSPTY